MGRVVPTGIEQVGDRTYKIDLPFPLTANGPYNFTLLSSALKDSQGFPLDQNANGVPGEPLADDYTFTLVVDTVPPYVSHQDPAGDVAGTIGHVNVWFSEAINTATFTTGDVTIVKPDGTTIAPTGIQNVGRNEFQVNFPAQTLVGTYHVKIGPTVTDVAGNGLDENGNGIGGEAADIYDGTFNLVNVDLGLSNVQVSPSTLWAGDPMTVSWSGQNVTGLPLEGNWADTVYLSTDNQWDINDTLLATVPHTGGLALNQTYTGSATVVLPGVLPGNYHILVRADVANQEKEGADKANNLADSGPIAIGVHPLATDGTAAQGTLTATDSSDYYYVQVNGGDALGLSLVGLAASGVNQLYVKLGTPPTRQDNDFKSVGDGNSPPGQNQQLALTAPPDGGTYFILVYGSQINGSNPYRLTATTGPFIVTGLNPDRGSNRAQSLSGSPIPHTITLNGAGFDESTQVEFIGPDGTVYSPTQTNLASSTAMTLDLDLPNWPTGTYDVRVSKGTTEKTLPQAFKVAEGFGHLETNLIVPSAVGFNIPIRQTIWIEYKNTGDAPMPAPLLELHGAFGARLTTDITAAIPTPGFGPLPGTSDTIQVIALGSSATPWILQPGESGRIPVYYVGLTQNAHYAPVSFTLGTLTADDNRPIAWTEQEALIRPPGIDDQDLEDFFQTIQKQVGDTWGSYVTFLSDAVRVPLQLQNPSGVPGSQSSERFTRHRTEYLERKNQFNNTHVAKRCSHNGPPR